MMGFTCGTGGTDTDISLADWGDAFTSAGRARRSLEELCEWWEHRHDGRVLLLFFDDVKADHRAVVAKMAQFMGRELDTQQIENVVETTTHRSMSSAEHHSRFDDHRIARVMAETVGLAWPRELTGKVRKDGGRSGDGKTLLPRHRQALDAAWKDIVEERLGFCNLGQMRDAWKAEQCHP
eukprot:SAG25_NODE_691_length_5916_cov_9.126698_3_plen_180_part_00